MVVFIGDPNLHEMRVEKTAVICPRCGETSAIIAKRLRCFSCGSYEVVAVDPREAEYLEPQS